MRAHGTIALPLIGMRYWAGRGKVAYSHKACLTDQYAAKTERICLYMLFSAKIYT